MFSPALSIGPIGRSLYRHNIELSGGTAKALPKSLPLQDISCVYRRIFAVRSNSMLESPANSVTTHVT